MNEITHSFFKRPLFKNTVLAILILLFIHIGFTMTIFGERASDVTKDGAIVPPSREETGLVDDILSVAATTFTKLMDFMVAPAFADNVILDDLIVDGSACVGMDCVNGESFGFDTIRLKENNLRIKFQDTSNSASFPSNDWQITINDSTNGGANKFSVDDIDSGRTPFTIEAGTRANALYVDDSGRVGLGVSNPAEDLHIWYGDTPTIRLAQSGSGWAPQTWDLAGNEANFFIRDFTNGSRLPFRIKPGAPTDSLYINSNGNVGFGTNNPAALLELHTTGEDAEFLIDRTNGAAGFISASGTTVFMGSKTNHPVDFVVNDQSIMRMDTGGLHVMANAIISGNLDLGSSRDLKKNIHPLQTKEAVEALKELRPVKYNYKIDPDEESIGFIAEDVPDLLATNSRKTVSPMDIVAVLAKVTQNQQELIEQLSRKVMDLEKKLKATSR
jgi:endosialidase-like protein